MPITDDSVNYFAARTPIRIGTASQGAETKMTGSFSSLQTRYDNLGTNTTLSGPDANNDGIISVGERFTVSSTEGNGESFNLTLTGAGTYTTNILGVPLTRNVLVGQTASGTQYVVFPNADAPTVTGQLTATLNIKSNGYNYRTGQVVCYLQGTKILTDHGPVAVEDLREGDRVVCRVGGLRPIRWVGRQHFTGRRAVGKEAIRFAPGSIGDGAPQEALFVSPGHSMLVGGMLVLASDLVNGISITREAPREEWSYFQLDLGDHDLVLANGAWSESFADCGDFRNKFDNAAEFHQRFPDHRAPEAPVLCAERPAGGARLHAALGLTARRALDMQEPPAPGRLEGRIEATAAGCHVTGWAMDADHPGRPVLLEVVLDGEVIGETCACAPRRNAKERGRMGFVFDGGRLLSGEELLKLVVRRKQDGQAIAPVASGAAGHLDGHLDLITDTCRLEGWARDRADPQRPVMLEVVLGGEVLGTVLACSPRADLDKAGLGDAAFVFEANRTLSADEIGAVHLRRASDGARLKRSEATRLAPSEIGKSRAA